MAIDRILRSASETTDHGQLLEAWNMNLLGMLALTPSLPPPIYSILLGAL